MSRVQESTQEPIGDAAESQTFPAFPGTATKNHRQIAPQGPDSLNPNSTPKAFLFDPLVGVRASLLFDANEEGGFGEEIAADDGGAAEFGAVADRGVDDAKDAADLDSDLDDIAGVDVVCAQPDLDRSDGLELEGLGERDGDGGEGGAGVDANHNGFVVDGGVFAQVL